MSGKWHRSCWSCWGKKNLLHFQLAWSEQRKTRTTMQTIKHGGEIECTATQTHTHTQVETLRWKRLSRSDGTTIKYRFRFPQTHQVPTLWKIEWWMMLTSASDMNDSAASWVCGNEELNWTLSRVLQRMSLFWSAEEVHTFALSVHEVPCLSSKDMIGAVISQWRGSAFV